MARIFVIPVLWLLVVLFLGSAHFGAQQTWALALPFLKPLAPWATTAELRAMHMLLRKLAHLSEYAVLALLWLRALRVGRHLSMRTACWAALLLCVSVAFVDEAHQATLQTRTGSAFDLLLDTLGALMVLMIARMLHELRGRARAAGRVETAALP